MATAQIGTPKTSPNVTPSQPFAIPDHEMVSGWAAHLRLTL
jgi:hypothetical protein